MFNTTYTPSSAIIFNVNARIFSIGNGTTAANRSNALTIYKSGLINLNDSYNMPIIDGVAGQVMTTDGVGNVTFVSPTVFTNTDNQTIDKLNLNGTTLELSLEDDAEADVTVDLSSLQIPDTDNQTIDNLNLNGTTLELSLEDDAEADVTVDLSSLKSPDVTTFSAAKILMSADQTLSGTGWDKLNFDTLSFDLNGNFNTTTDRFVAVDAGQ